VQMSRGFHRRRRKLYRSIISAVSLVTSTSVASERNQRCGGEATNEEPELEARRAEPGRGLLGGGGPPPYQLGGLGKRCKLLQLDGGEAPVAPVAKTLMHFVFFR